MLIQNGTIIDGTGAPPYKADIMLSGDKIASIDCDIDHSPSIPSINISELIVCPGFIDTHSHSDFSLLVSPEAGSALHQGVTTEVIGNCGLSLFPVAEHTKDQLQSYIRGLGYDTAFPADWTDLEGYSAAFDRKGISINVVPLIGHGSLRIAVMGFEPREAKSHEIKEMKYLLDCALDQGVLGLSSGLVYPPGIDSPTWELEKLCEVVGNKHAIYTTHLRGDTTRSGPSLVESLDEALTIAQNTGVQLHVSHAAPKFPNTGSVQLLLEKMQIANENGIRVSCDAHPYLAAMTFLATLLPSWVFEGGIKKTLQRLRNHKIREKVLEIITSTFAHLDADEFWSLNEVVLPDPQSENNRCRMDVVAKKMGLKPAEALVELLAKYGEKIFEVIVLQWIYSAEETRELFDWPNTMVGADGATSSIGSDIGTLTNHPRSWGTFPKVINEYYKKSRFFSLEEIIHRMTGLPAACMGLNDRGTIQTNKKADLIVLNIEKFNDKASYTDPYQYAEGIEYVWVNGQMVIDRGRHTGLRPGKVLRRSMDS
jgi:N-acyl-D-aspartate/D-glutamate deacylase